MDHPHPGRAGHPRRPLGPEHPTRTFIHTEHHQRSVTSGNAPPSQRRAAWRSHLRERTSTIAHDVFTPAGLGHHTARVYQTLATTATSSTDLATALGYSPDRTREYLEQLVAAGLAQHRTAGWSRPPADRRDSTARTRGCAGILAARQRRHHIERQAWQWWLDELAWRRASRAQQRRTPGHDQQALPLPGLLPSRRHRGAHPTRPGGRADFRAALNQLRTTGDADQRAAS